MSDTLSNYEILKNVLERIPKGDSFDYTSCPVQIIKVDEKEIDVWIGNKSGQTPQIVQKMIDVVLEEGYKVTYTIVAKSGVVAELKKEKKQVGLKSWFG